MYESDPSLNLPIISQSGDAITATVQIHLNEVNIAPVLATIGNKQLAGEAVLALTATATDPDPGQTLRYTLGAGTPAGASISTSRDFSWTPTADQAPGTYTITVIVSDGISSDSESFTVTVTAPQQASPAPRPFWEQYWYILLIVALVLLGIPVRDEGSSKA